MGCYVRWDSAHNGCDTVRGGRGAALERGVSDCIRCEFAIVTWEWYSVRESQRGMANFKLPLCSNKENRGMAKDQKQKYDRPKIKNTKETEDPHLQNR